MIIFFSTIEEAAKKNNTYAARARDLLQTPNSGWQYVESGLVEKQRAKYARAYKPVLVEGTVFASLSEAARFLKLHVNSVRKCIQ